MSAEPVDEGPMDPAEALSRLRLFVQKATRWNEGADEFAREIDVYGALSALNATLKRQEAT